jgi:hypothetical protein
VRKPAVVERRAAAKARPVAAAAHPVRVPGTWQRQLGNRGTQALAARVVARSSAPGPLPGGGPSTGAFSLSHPDDAHEREAERVADAVMRPAVQRSPVSPSVPTVQRACAHCEEEMSARGGRDHSAPASDATPVHRSPRADRSSEISEPVGANIRAMQGGGAPLPASTRAIFEPRFGADFSHVRVHTGGRADATAKAISAKAFTVGSDIAFAGGQYSPDSREGQHLLAHELTHVLQQGAGAPGLNRQADGVEPAPAMRPGARIIQRAWYNFDIPFTDYQFDPSLEGVKTAAGLVKDVAAEGLQWVVDEITSLVNSGIEWLSDRWNGIKAFASSAFNAARDSFANILEFIKNPFGVLADALMSLDAEAVQRAWARLSGLVSTVANGFKAVADNLLQGVNSIWNGINGFAVSLLSRVAGLTNNFLFKKLPDALQNVATSFVNRLKSFWKKINDSWNALFRQIRTWVEGALDVVFDFVRKVLSFGINVVIAGIITFGKIVLFLKDFFADPQKYLAILGQRAVQAFDGVETKFAGIAAQYFPTGKMAPARAAAQPLTVHRQPEPSPAAPETKRTATWSEIGNGVLDLMGKKWREFKANPLQLVVTLLLDLYLPIVGNVKDVIQLFADIKKAASAPLSAGSLQEFWTSLLLILEIPRLIAHTVVGILMRTLMLPLIVASFIPEPIVQTIATAVGYALLGAFVQLETINLAHKLLLLKTGLTVKSQRDDACNSIADSLIALIMAGVMIVIVLLLKFIASVARGIVNFIKGKVFTPEVKPVETKGPGSGEGKGGTGENKEPAGGKTVDVDDAPAKRMETSAKTGLDPTPDTIRDGSVRMEAHPSYDATMAEVKRLGFEVKKTSGDPHVTVREVVNPKGDVLRVEKELHVRDGMRFLDLEHELGHIKQLTERFGPKARPTERWIEYPDGKMKEVSNPSGEEVLTKWQDTVTEYHNRLQEWLRLKSRNAGPELLKEHADGIRRARVEYRDKGLKGGSAGQTRPKWIAEHFPDLPDLERKYIDAGGLVLE